MDKAHFRATLSARRKQLSPSWIASHSQQIIQHILKSDIWHNATHIALYLPFNGEVDLRDLLSQADKQLYLPSIQGQQMQFQLFQQHIPLKQHAYGMGQPDFINGLKAPALDLCLMPLLGFDLYGNRLGMGGGYYDRYFAPPNHTVMAAVAYQFQHIEQLPADQWDVKLHHIFSEQGIHTV